MHKCAHMCTYKTHMYNLHTYTHKGISAVKSSDQMHFVLWMMSFPSVNGRTVPSWVMDVCVMGRLKVSLQVHKLSLAAVSQKTSP